MQEAVAEAGEKARQLKEEGVDQAALDAAAAKEFANALFEYDEDEVTQVVEEFYPASVEEGSLDKSSIMSKLRKDLNTNEVIPG